MRPRPLLMVLALVASLAACGDDDSTGPAPSKIPTGVTWKLECIRPLSGDTCYDPDLGQTYSIRFETDGTVSGTNACNACNGTYTSVSATRIVIDWSCTEAACGVPVPWLGYDDAIVRVTSFVLSADGLVLNSVDPGGQPLQLVHRRTE